MTKERLNPNRISALLCQIGLGTLLASATVAGDVKVPRPGDYELARLVGQPLPAPWRTVIWQAGNPPQSNLLIYAVEPAKYNSGHLQRIAEALGVKGSAEPMPSDFLGAPGYWIRERNPTNTFTWKSVYLSLIAGELGFSSGEDNHRWDLKNHRPLTTGVPAADEALKKTLALLPVLGLTTNDLEHTQSGLRWTWDTEGTTYTDREDGKRKRYIRQINITLWQPVLGGGRTLSVGSGGVLTAGFMSEGKLAELKLLFRNGRSVGEARPQTRNDVIRALRAGKAYSFRELVPSSVTVTNCELVYPQGTTTTRQTHLWPFYALTGIAVEAGVTNAVSLYVPLDW
jgi:hypothetical protein